MKEQEVGLSVTVASPTPACRNGKPNSAGLEAKRLKTLEDENTRLKRLLADAMVDNATLKDLSGNRWVTPAAKRKAIALLRKAFGMSERRACRGIGCWRYQTTGSGDAGLRQ